MGSCFNAKSVSSIEGYESEFKKDKSIIANAEYVQPLQSTLYTLLRKGKQVQIISTSSKHLFKNQTSPNLEALKPSDIKTLYSFKTILFVGSKKNVDKLNTIKENSNPKALYFVSESFAKSFLDSYPIYSYEAKKFEVRSIPLLAFSTEDIVKGKNEKNRTYFVHAEEYKNDEAYKGIGIDEVVKYQQSQSANIDRLEQSQGKKVLFMHPAAVRENVLFPIFAAFMEQKYKVNSINAQIYLKKCFPNAELKYEAGDLSPRPSSKNVASDQLSLQQKYSLLFANLYKQMGASPEAEVKLERSYNLLATYITNIYSNKDSESYRKIKKTNKQIDDLLGKYENGKKLLKETGFISEGGFYVNKMDSKYLKILKTDLSLGFKNYRDNL